MTTISTTSIWIVIVLAGIGTQAIRWSFLATLGENSHIPDLAMRALRLIPAAVLAALVLPALIRPGGSFEFPWENLRLLAGVGAALVAWKTHNVMATIATGMGLLWLLTWLT